MSRKSIIVDSKGTREEIYQTVKVVSPALLDVNGKPAEYEKEELVRIEINLPVAPHINLTVL